MTRALVALLVLLGVARAAPPAPHPRILLDAGLRAAWREQAGEAHGPIKGAIALCEDARTSHEHDGAQYQGSEWAKTLQACLVAWAATGRDEDAQTAIRFFNALLDDLDKLGDKRGGDEAARRDHGYAIRNLGPYTAIAYDWLYDKLSPDVRAKARGRWKAWLDWYREKGYRPATPGTNYHAGYALTLALVAIAERGDDDSLWQPAVDMWTKQIAPAFAEGGVLDGGDWPEGWQYGPLAVAELALGLRAFHGVGVDIPGGGRWLDALLQRHVYALSPAGGVYAGGDTEAETANLQPNVLVLDAVALGPASADSRRWARGELSRLQLADKDSLLYDALAGVGDRPVLPPRAKWPTWYVARGTGTLYARTRWDERAIWFVAECASAIDVDHRHPSAGTFVVSRGKDDVLVDPSPYGSASTLTSNAPTVVSAQLPDNYKPSQGYWSTRTGWDFTTQRASGVVAARCDYSDTYKFQDRKSDVPDALRDFVLVPSADGTDAVLVVIDRADTGDGSRGMDLRFRTPGHLQLAGETATATVGASKLVIAPIAKSNERVAIGTPSAKDCFAADVIRGQCDAARFPVTDYRVTVPGPTPSVAHALAIAGAPPQTAPLSGDGWQGAHITGVRDASIVWRTRGKGDFAYRAPPGLHVILDAPDQGGFAKVTARRDGDACAVTVTPGGDISARPVIVTLDANCAVAADPESGARSAAGTHPVSKPAANSPRAGCCGAQTTPGSSLAMTIVVAAFLARRRQNPR